MIRKATLKDLNEIERIYVEGSIDEGKLQFPNVSRKAMIKQLKKDAGSRKKELRQNLKNKKHFFVVTEIGSKVAGFGQAWLRKDSTGIIEDIYIDKKHRRKGFGAKIALMLIKWLKKNKVKYIESSAFLKNAPSIKLHKKLGFKPICLKMRLK